LTLSRKVALTVAGVITLLATGLGTIPNSQANSSQAPSSAVAALQQRRAQLIAELAALQPSLRAAGGSVGSAEASFNAQQTKVLHERNQLAHLNATLLSMSSQLASNDATVAQNKQQLAAITRATYETSGGNQVLAAVLSAPSFNQAMDELKSANQVSQQVLALVERLASADRAIRYPSPSRPSRFATGTKQSSNTSSAAGHARIPIFFSWVPNVKPAMPFSTRNAAIPRDPAVGSTEANTR